METPERIDEAYWPFPFVSLAFMIIWFFSSACWIIHTYRNRHFQTNKLHWTLAAVPLIKSLQLTLSFLFWYSCFYLNVCSLWLSFGVFVTGVLFQTTTCVSFLLISLGYCITCELLTVSERRRTSILGCVFYLTLVGYRASVPYFSVLLLFNYFISFYGISRQVSQNLRLLREQLSIIEDEDVQAMRDAVFAKYIMFKKFQGAVHILAMTELAIFINMENSMEYSWLRSMFRELAHFSIFLYVGWIFRPKEPAPRFSVMPILKSRHKVVPPIYSIEVDAATFRDFTSHKWHIGVPTSKKGDLEDSGLVVIQHPRIERLAINTTSPSRFLLQPTRTRSQGFSEQERKAQSKRIKKSSKVSVMSAGGAFGGNRGVKPVPPEKGVFPLDRMHLCGPEMKEYLNCLKTSGHKSEKCRQFSKRYLECRMEKNLMAKQDMSELGFKEERDIETRQDKNEN